MNSKNAGTGGTGQEKQKIDSTDGFRAQSKDKRQPENQKTSPSNADSGQKTENCSDDQRKRQRVQHR